MSRTPAKFTQADIARALKAASQCEDNWEVVLEPDGRIRITPAKPTTKIQVDVTDSIRL